jgi:hypothetical protein
MCSDMVVVEGMCNSMVVVGMYNSMVVEISLVVVEAVTYTSKLVAVVVEMCSSKE